MLHESRPFAAGFATSGFHVSSEDKTRGPHYFGVFSPWVILTFFTANVVHRSIPDLRDQLDFPSQFYCDAYVMDILPSGL